MKTVVAVFPPRIGEGHKRGAGGADAEGLATKPVQEQDAANRHILFDCMASIPARQWRASTPQ
jgi:hypothetical protein